MPHFHACEDCDVWFHCEELVIDNEAGGRCSVEPARCPDCQADLDAKPEPVDAADRLQREGRY